jgi:hypothetical protein
MKSTNTHHEIPKLDDEQIRLISDMKYTNHGCGIIQFHGAINVPQEKVLPYIDEYAYIPSCGLNIVELEDGTKVARDFEGNEQPYENLLALPMRLGGFGMPSPVEEYTPPEIVDFFVECERALYRGLMRYTDLFPMILNTLWWKCRGHVLKYLPGASLGMHNDNDTNYRVMNGQRYFTPREVAMYQVVNALAYFNDDYEGGEFRFPYADVTVKPKTGDIIFFPANYIGTHAVAPVKSGQRYTYLTQFGHGNAKNTEVVEPHQSNDWLPPVYMPFVYQDHERLVKSGISHYDDSKDLALGLHANTPLSQGRSVEGAPVGTYIPYE